MRSIPVLSYHHILPDAKRESGVLSVDAFEAQMAYLSKRGFKTLSSEEFLAFKQGKMVALPHRSVFITFDVGWRNNFIYAYPILKKYDLKATMFLVTEWVEEASRLETDFESLGHEASLFALPRNPRSVMMNWGELAIIKDVFDFQSHTHTHRETYFPTVQWHEDFEISKTLIRERLDAVATHLCWPRGHYTQGLMRTAKAMGYEAFYTIEKGINLPDGNCDEIRRIRVKEGVLWLAKTLFLFSRPRLGRWCS